MSEHEKLSGFQYGANLKEGTLLKGIPNDLKRTLLFDMNGKTTYEQMRSRLLEYETSSQTWSAENILNSLRVQDASTKRKEYQGPILMELDRVKRKDGKGKGKGDGYKGEGRGLGGLGRGPGKGKGRGRGKRGKGKCKCARQVGEKGEGGNPARVPSVRLSVPIPTSA